MPRIEIHSAYHLHVRSPGVWGVVSTVTVLVLLLAACDSVRPSEFESEYVVESFLIAGEPLPSVRLSRTAPIDATYDATTLAVHDANVRVELLKADGEVASSYPFEEISYAAGETAVKTGVYEPMSPSRARPLRTYRLIVTIPETGARVTSSTVVPDTFRVVEANTDRVVFQGEEQLDVTVTRSFYPGRQNIFIFTTEAMAPSEDQLTPFAKALFDDGEEVTLEDLRVNSSPLLNEANYDENPDGTFTITLPWLAVAFYGPNRISISAVDDNMFDFIRSQSVQQGGSTFSPGEIPNVIDHVEGGRGVFGSLARQSYDVVIER